MIFWKFTAGHERWDQTKVYKSDSVVFNVKSVYWYTADSARKVLGVLNTIAGKEVFLQFFLYKVARRTNSCHIKLQNISSLDWGIGEHGVVEMLIKHELARKVLRIEIVCQMLGTHHNQRLKKEMNLNAIMISIWKRSPSNAWL